MKHKRYLMAFAISFFTCLEALAQFAGVVEQFPTSDYSQKPACFKLSEITAALETDAATLVDALDSWVNEESEPNMFFLKLADGLSDNYSDGKGCFWVNVAGIPQEWSDDNSDLRWYSNIGWNLEDDVFIIYMGQCPDQCVLGDEFNPVFVLKYGEKTVDLYVTFRIIAKPEIPVPTTLVESELNIVGEKEIVVEQNPRINYDVDIVKVNILDAISELGIDNNMILTDMLGEILYCTDGSYSDTGLFVKKDQLTNEPGCFNAIQNDEGEETGECASTTWGNLNKIYVNGFNYNTETFELSCRLGQNPGILMSGDQYFVNFYLIWGDKAYKLTYRLKITGEVTPDVVTNKGEASAMGFYYNLISKIKEAEVISNPNKYGGSIIVPQSVIYNGEVYTVTSISESAFSNNSISSVILPNTITTIKSNAFYNCPNLSSIILREGITTIEYQAFTNCKRLSSISLPNSLTCIGNAAFSGCSGLTSVNIPNSVTSIGSSAFSGCSGLTSVNISDLAAWCNIPFTDSYSNPLYYAHHLFLNGEEVKDLIIPNSVTSIGSSAFSGCSGLTSVNIPNNVTSIGRFAFSGCSSLTSVNIPNSVTSIGNSVFFGCSGLTSVAIPNSVTYIDNSAFKDCSSLTSVTIPNSVTIIWGYAFSGCSGLTSITIGPSVTKIDYQAFENCQELTDVYCYAEEVPNTYSDAFDGSYIEYATLHVPASAFETYRTTEPWSGFGTIVVIDGETPTVDKCATPTITYANGKVRFSCETEGVEFLPSIMVTPNQLQNGNELSIGGTFTVSVYAVKDGYDNSDTATMTINMSQMGDVNGDGQLNVADVTSLVNAILGK